MSKRKGKNTKRNNRSVLSRSFSFPDTIKTVKITSLQKRSLAGMNHNNQVSKVGSRIKGNCTCPLNSDALRRLQHPLPDAPTKRETFQSLTPHRVRWVHGQFIKWLTFQECRGHKRTITEERRPNIRNKSCNMAAWSGIWVSAGTFVNKDVAEVLTPKASWLLQWPCGYRRC